MQMRNRVIIRGGAAIKCPVISTRVPVIGRFLRDHVKWGGATTAGWANDPEVYYVLKFLFSHLQTIQSSCNRWTLCLNVMSNIMFDVVVSKHRSGDVRVLLEDVRVPVGCRLEDNRADYRRSGGYTTHSEAYSVVD